MLLFQLARLPPLLSPAPNCKPPPGGAVAGADGLVQKQGSSRARRLLPLLMLLCGRGKRSRGETGAARVPLDRKRSRRVEREEEGEGEEASSRGGPKSTTCGFGRPLPGGRSVRKMLIFPRTECVRKLRERTWPREQQQNHLSPRIRGQMDTGTSARPTYRYFCPPLAHCAPSFFLPLALSLPLLTPYEFRNPHFSTLRIHQREQQQHCQAAASWRLPAKPRLARSSISQVANTNATLTPAPWIWFRELRHH